MARDEVVDGHSKFAWISGHLSDLSWIGYFEQDVGVARMGWLAKTCQILSAQRREIREIVDALSAEQLDDT